MSAIEQRQIAVLEKEIEYMKKEVSQLQSVVYSLQKHYWIGSGALMVIIPLVTWFLNHVLK
jgi:cell division protein FtsB